jgi:cytochrome c oxidase assembly factor CtaG
MVQHLMLTMVAAPLMVMSDVGTFLLWALPTGGRRAVGRLIRARIVRVSWRALTQPVAAWALHAAALVLWHVPWFYELAITDERVHALEHWTFFGTALLFWWPALAPRTRQRLHFGSSIVYLFTAATATGILGAMISMSTVPWYVVHARWTASWGLTPLEDQQIAGLIMWIPAAIIYLGALVPTVIRTLSNRARVPSAAGTRVAI